MFGRQRKLVRQFVLLFALLVLIAYVASDAIRAPHGLIANHLLKSRVATLKAELASLKARRIRLERDAQLLGAGAAAQPELLDAQARALLDLANPTDIIIVNDEKSDR
ncbi:MAG TPA: septum formation initiator family protein [Hyphomicrobiales bacterium]|nr:septum formation initiator family protein [Hyphomicrobiales bacterium]